MSAWHREQEMWELWPRRYVGISGDGEVEVEDEVEDEVETVEGEVEE